MRRIDSLISREIVGPWLFGVGLFTALIFATTFLGRLTGYIVDGVPPLTVAQVFVLLMPAMLVKTFPMAVLLAALLSFGRLSSDSEIVALRASGTSLFRIIAPVTAFSVVIAVVAFACNEAFVPVASRRVLELTTEISKMTNLKASRPVTQAFSENGKVRFFISARAIDILTQQMQGVVITALDDDEKPAYTLTCERLEFHGEEDWRILGKAKLTAINTPRDQAPNVVYLEDGVWPSKVPKVRATIADMIADRKDEFDTMSMATLHDKIEKSKLHKSETPDTIHNMEYGYYNKVSVPLAAFIFGSLGAVLGIRNHRTGTATGFALAIGIIFGYVMLGNFMSLLMIPAWMASFTPIFLGVGASLWITWARNR